MLAVAVDWSGRAGTTPNLWVAHARDGVLCELHREPSRRDAVDHLLATARREADVVVGLDFCFSFPAWFCHRHDAETVRAVWELATRHGEQWLAQCPPPFWGRPGRPKPDTAEPLRRTERHIAAAAGVRLKSVFQVGGAGAVGTGSLRGMPYLAVLQDAGFAIWPFDDAAPPLAVEIYPRLFTGPVVKSDPEARGRVLAGLGAAIPERFRAAAAGSEDAFDAAVSALVMARHTGLLASMPATADARSRLEGAIWMPPPDPTPPVASSRRGSVADRLAIADLVHAYAQAADHADSAAMAALFTENGALTIYAEPDAATPRSVLRGRRVLTDRLASLGRFSATSHVIGNHVADVDGDHARGETRCVAHHVSGEGAAARLLVWHLRYFDRYAKVDGRWLIEDRVLRVDFIAEGPLTAP